MSDISAIMKKILPPKLERDLAVASHNVKAKRACRSDAFGLLEYPEDGYLDCFVFDSNFVANCFYGTEPALRRYSGYPSRISAAIEHGVYFGTTVESEATINPYPGLITFSPQRVKHLRAQFDRLILPIGPYIQYYEPFLSQSEQKALHHELGRTLLVFPKHSIEAVTLHADLSQTVAQIDQLKADRDIQTVLVCLYFNDIPTKLPSFFASKGYRVVCCGHRSDPSFLSRQRSLIELSDLTASNSVGTHIGYCHFLGKEHVLFNQDYMEDDFRRGTISYGKDAAGSRTKEMAVVEHAFSPSGSPSERDNVVAKYWGTKNIRSPEELYLALNIFDEVYSRTKSTSDMNDVARAIASESDDPRVTSLVNEMLGGADDD